MAQVYIVAETILKAGQLPALMPALRALVEASRAETGNIRYDLTRDPENPDHLFFLEVWESAEAVARHNASPHFAAFKKAEEGRAEKVIVHKLEKLL